MTAEAPARCRVLLVEDDELVSEFLAGLLRRALPRACVSTRAEAQAALAAYRDERPDLVITDLKLSEMSGAELVAEIRKTDQITPILVITGAPDVFAIPGATEVVSKLQFSYLIGRVRQLLVTQNGERVSGEAL